MKEPRIFTKWTLFLEHSITDENEQNEIQKEVNKILTAYFSGVSRLSFHDDVVEFEPDDPIEYNLDYTDEDLKMNYSFGVLKKRKYAVSLKFDSKTDDGKLIFKVVLKPTSEMENPKKKVFSLKWSFEKDPESLIEFLDEEEIPYRWNEESKILSIKNTVFEQDKEEIEVYINETEGVLVNDEDLEETEEVIDNTGTDDEETEITEIPILTKKVKEPRERKIKTTLDPIEYVKNEPESKTCNQCHSTKPIDEFRLHKSGGRVNRLNKCKQCERDDAKAKRTGVPLKHLKNISEI